MNDENVPEFPPSALIDSWKRGWDHAKLGLFPSPPKETYAAEQYLLGYVAGNR